MTSGAAVGLADPTVYPVEERVGEDILQRWIVELLRPLVERWLARSGSSGASQAWFVGADQFIYYRQYDPKRSVAPDLYVLPGVPGGTRVRAWKTWETGIVPSFALEIVSQDWEKDYRESPHRYAEVGTSEFVLYDLDWQKHPDGVKFQRFLRGAENDGEGGFGPPQRTQGDRIESRVLGCFLREVSTQRGLRLRLGSGPSGDELFPTAEEAERQATEAQRQATESQRQATEAALARIAELEEALRSRK